MEGKAPKVAVCIPSGDMVYADFALCLATLCYHAKPLDINIVSNKSSIVAQARNNGVARAQDWGADYLLFLDSDMVFPPAALVRLLAHGKHIVGATYARRVPPFSVLGKPLEPRREEEGLLAMEHLPTGCLLIHMDVFDALKKPYFRFTYDEDKGTIGGEDYVFCDLARKAGFEVWCDADLSMEIGHLGQRAVRVPGAQASEA